MKNKSVVYFDGICGLCNGFVNFLLKIDRREKLYFSTLQDSSFTKMDSVIFKEGTDLYYKSDAVLAILIKVGGPWRVVYIFKIIPRSLLDFFYDLLAKHRYKIFGKRVTCRFPNESERKRFIFEQVDR